MSRSRRSSPLSELRTLQKSRDALGLRQLYFREGKELAQSTGLEVSRLVQLAQGPDSEVLQGSTRVLDLALHRAREQKLDEGTTRATRAAQEIQRTARWQDGAVYLDVHVVLGDLLAAPGKYYCFSVEGEHVLVPKIRLARVRPLARRLDGLSVYLMEHALCFRWRGGRGGLDLYCQSAGAGTPDEVFHVHLERPQKIQPAPRALRRFVTQVMTELEHFSTT